MYNEDEHGNPSSLIPAGRPWRVRLFLHADARVKDLEVAVGLRSADGLALRSTWGEIPETKAGDLECVFSETCVLLSAGTYPLVVGLSLRNQPVQYVEDAGRLEIGVCADGLHVKDVTHGVFLNQMGFAVQQA